ncbi:DUF4157 domain-containing protein [Dyella choica]|nr:DUF4157 domain-containing protein [Dyella choica]
MASMEAAPNVHQVIDTPGQPLDSGARQFMESGFGRNFSHVRVHTDEAAASSAHSLQAQAYTVGAHVVFANGKYAPHSTSGRHLLAHELAHVVQQQHVRGDPGSISEAGSALERDADHAADRVMTGAHPLGLMSAARPVLSRQSAPSADGGQGAGRTAGATGASAADLFSPLRLSSFPCRANAGVYQLWADRKVVVNEDCSRWLVHLNRLATPQPTCNCVRLPQQNPNLSVMALAQVDRLLTLPVDGPCDDDIGSRAFPETQPSAPGRAAAVSEQMSQTVGIGVTSHSYLTRPGATDPAREAVVQLANAYTRQYHRENRRGVELQMLDQVQISLTTGQVSVAGGGQLSYVIPFGNNRWNWAAFAQVLAGGTVGTGSPPNAQLQPTAGTQIAFQPWKWLQINAQGSVGPTLQSAGPNSIDVGGMAVIQFTQ